MIRLVFLLRRKEGMTLEEFQDYWLNQHAPLVASVSTDLNILRYVQTHTIDHPINKAAQNARGGNMEPQYDGVAELWWATESDLESALASEVGQAAGAKLLADERTFIDLEASPLWLAYEYPQVNPTPENISARVNGNILRVFFPLRHLDSLNETDVRKYWLTHHGPIVRAGAPAAGILCYRQVHRADSHINEVLRTSRGTVTPDYLGHAEVWTDQSRTTQTTEAKNANQSFLKDEFNFIDMERSAIWVGKEHTIIDKRLGF